MKNIKPFLWLFLFGSIRGYQRGGPRARGFPAWKKRPGPLVGGSYVGLRDLKMLRHGKIIPAAFLMLFGMLPLHFGRQGPSVSLAETKIAYTLREGNDSFITIMDHDGPGVVRHRAYRPRLQDKGIPTFEVGTGDGLAGFVNQADASLEPATQDEFNLADLATRLGRKRAGECRRVAGSPSA